MRSSILAIFKCILLPFSIVLANPASGQEQCQLDKLIFPCDAPTGNTDIEYVPLQAIPLLPNIIEIERMSLDVPTHISDVNMNFSSERLTSAGFPNFVNYPGAYTDEISDLGNKTTVWLVDENAAGLTAVEAVFRGRDALDFWVSSLGIEKACVVSEYDQDLINCFFTRKVKNFDETAIQHCEYDIEKEVAGALRCIVVATLEPYEQVVALKTAYWPDLGADGGAIIFCIFPGMQWLDAQELVTNLVNTTFGDNATFVTLPLGKEKILRAEGININSLHSSAIVRLFLWGVLKAGVGIPEDIWALEGFDSTSLATAEYIRLDYATQFTVSPRFSSDITDYREPNEVMSSEIASNFDRAAKQILDAHSPDHACTGGVF